MLQWQAPVSGARPEEETTMSRRFVDLSIFLENDVLSDPPAFAPKIEYFTHENTYAQIAPFFPGLRRTCPTARLGGELVQLSTHNGTT